MDSECGGGNAKYGDGVVTFSYCPGAVPGKSLSCCWLHGKSAHNRSGEIIQLK